MTFVIVYLKLRLYVHVSMSIVFLAYLIDRKIERVLVIIVVMNYRLTSY
jgi:hypothetical protein